MPNSRDIWLLEACRKTYFKTNTNLKCLQLFHVSYSQAPTNPSDVFFFSIFSIVELERNVNPNVSAFFRKFVFRDLVFICILKLNEKLILVPLKLFQ